MADLLKFITCGSVDDGKSTLIGHMLYDAKLIFTDQERALELDSKVGSAGGGIDYSLLLDGLMAEREQGITIDVAYRYFTTEKRSFIVADTPGHEEYTRNMAVGASFADLAVILVTEHSHDVNDPFPLKIPFNGCPKLLRRIFIMRTIYDHNRIFRQTSKTSRPSCCIKTVPHCSFLNLISQLPEAFNYFQCHRKIFSLALSCNVVLHMRIFFI